MPYFVTRHVERGRLWKDDQKVSVGIDFTWIVDNIRLFDVMAAYWDEEIQKTMKRWIDWEVGYGLLDRIY